MSFNIATAKENDKLVVTLKGNLDEDAAFQPVDLGSSLNVVLDLEGVSTINSVGIREWIKWTRTFPAAVSLAVRNCPKIIVDQINMVSGFLPATTKVQSFFVPYYSEASGSEKMVLFQEGKEYGPEGVKLPEAVKDESGEAMEMDVIESKYFKFLKG